MNKFPKEQWASLIDKLIIYYPVTTGIPKDKYPRPVITSLSQTWIMNLIIAAEEKAKEVTSLKQQKEEARITKEVQVEISDRFYVRLIENDLDDMFYRKRDRLLNKPWINDMEYPIDEIRSDIENA